MKQYPHVLTFCVNNFNNPTLKSNSILLINLRKSMNFRLKCAIILLIPLALSAYTHLWNLLGFPSFHIDEAHYMRRAMLVLEGMGPQESASSGYPRTYDHPYLGQLFLGGVLGIVGYPNSISPNSTEHSIEILHLIPRLMMGILAVLDTFILFKIAERRYNTTIALITSLLFAIMPYTWIFRRVYLDTLLMPFLLSSILFAIYLKNTKISGKQVDSKADYKSAIYLKNTKISGKQVDSKADYKLHKNILILLSGIFLGLAIYTKVPAFTMIPLVGTLVFFNTGKSLKRLGIWFIPVIIVPLLWPLYSVVAGQSDLWVEWVLWQTDRHKPLLISLTNLFQIDPIITIIGIAGMVIAAIRKDFLPLLWVSPFLVFSFFIGWVQYFHLVLIFPAFCLATAISLNFLQKLISKYSYKILSYSVIIFVLAFGIVATSMLITLDVNSSYYKVYATIAEQIPYSGGANSTRVTLIGSHWWVWDSYWITQYVLNKHHELIDPHFDPKFKQEIGTEKVLFVDDSKFLKALATKLKSDNLHKIKELHNQSNVIDTFTDNVTSHTTSTYPYNTLPIMILNENRPTGKVVIKSNY